MRLFSSFALVVLLAGCGDMKVEVQNQRGAKGASMLVRCASPRLEVGLRAGDRPVPERINNVSVQRQPIRSIVRVFDAASGEKVYDHTAETPVVFWMSEEKIGHVEYFGLQEMTLPFTAFCRDYRVELAVGDLPPGFDDGAGPRFMSYVRAAKRP